MNKIYIKSIQGRLLSPHHLPIDICERNITDSRGHKLNWNTSIESFKGLISISMNFIIDNPSNEIEKNISERITEILGGKDAKDCRFYGDFIFGEILQSEVNDYLLV